VCQSNISGCERTQEEETFSSGWDGLLGAGFSIGSLAFAANGSFGSESVLVL